MPNKELMEDLLKLKTDISWYYSNECSPALVVRGVQDKIKEMIHKAERGRYETDDPDVYQGLKDAIMPQPKPIRIVSSLTIVDDPEPYEYKPTTLNLGYDGPDREPDYSRMYPDHDPRDDWDFDHNDRGGTY